MTEIKILIGEKDGRPALRITHEPIENLKGKDAILAGLVVGGVIRAGEEMSALLFTEIDPSLKL